MDVLEYLLRAPPLAKPVSDIQAWMGRIVACPFSKPFDRALWAGFEADRLGYAFAGGYRAALTSLFSWAAQATSAPAHLWPSIDVRLSLAATEAKGAHPRAIATKLVAEGESLLLDGEKTFATLASAADE
ncbi:MAG TPA: hypothetical protein VM580_07585, partial [Labilithrix sp.]|nr:hypothetical protein [Labilithrix sp.]